MCVFHSGRDVSNLAAFEKIAGLLIKYGRPLKSRQDTHQFALNIVRWGRAVVAGSQSYIFRDERNVVILAKLVQVLLHLGMCISTN